MNELTFVFILFFWVPWTARRSNQASLKKSTLNIHWRNWSEAEAAILWSPDTKSWFIGKDPDAKERLRAGGKRSSRGWVDWIASPAQWTWICTNWEIVKKRGTCHATVHGITKSRTWLGDCITTNQLHRYYKLLSYPFHYVSNSKTTPFRAICISHHIF